MPKTEQPLDLFALTLVTEKLLRDKAQRPGIGAYKPHPSQLRFHESTHKEKLYIGGNRSGKTVAGVTEAVMWLTGKHSHRNDLPLPPLRGRAVAVDIELGIKKFLLPEFQKWIPPSFLKNGSWEDSYEVASRTLTLSNDSFIEFMSYEQEVEKFAGTSRHFIFFDEEPPEDIYDECMMRLVDTNGDYWISMTPLIEMTWIKDRIYDPWAAGDTSIFVLEVDTEENPHISSAAVGRLTRGMTKEMVSTRTQGKFITYTGLIYGDNFSFQLHPAGHVMDKPLENYGENFQHFVCMDHGLRNPTVFLFCAFDGDGRIIVYDELYIDTGKNIIKANCEKYLRKLAELGVSPLYCVGDPSIQNKSAITGTSIQSEYAEHGVGIALGNNAVNAGIGRIQNRFDKNALFIHMNCFHTLHELGNYRWDRFASSKIANRKNAKEMPLKKNDHCMDAMRYGVASQPAYEGEEEMQEFGNFLGAAEPASDYDRTLQLFERPEPEVFDEQLGIVW